MRDLYETIVFRLLYRRLLLRRTKTYEGAERSRLKHSIAKAWDRIFIRWLPDRKYMLDMVLVVPPAARGWILDAICKEIMTYFTGKCQICYDHRSLPPAKSYFFAHYRLVKDAILQTPQIGRSKLLVWYTHPSDVGLSEQDLVYWLNQLHCVVATCSIARDQLISQGVAPSRVSVVLGAADPELFPGHKRRSTGSVGICSAFYERKDPDRVIDIVSAMPHRHFILMGKGWERYQRFAELNAYPNFEYRQGAYSEYPKFYAALSVFLTVSKLEGGPIPLVEAMMENVVPVASNTGFARDLIEHGQNGYLFDVDAETSVICMLIDLAFEINANVRQAVERYSWRRFSGDIQRLVTR
jgi:glycosyltransferase involved in cell wall biosynthesis